MPSLTENRRAALQKATLLLIAVALNAIELAIPRLPFFPWLKPGFANIITVLWIIKYGCRDVLLYTALRIWISGFYFGFSLFTFSLSLCGGLLSTIAMSFMWLTLGKRGWAGTVGMAMIGALFHNAGQLAVVYLMMARNIGVLGQIPFMLGASILFGGIVGAAAPGMAKVAGFYDDGGNLATLSDKHNLTPPSNPDKLIVALAFALSISLMFVDNVTALISAAIMFSLIASVLTKNAGKLLYPLNFYMMFLFVAATHIFFTYGTRIEFIPLVTKEGLLAFVKQSLRLWCWLQTIHIFRRFKFHEIFMSILSKSFPNRKDTLEAGMIALKHFPEITRFSGKTPVFAILFKPKATLTEYVLNARDRIAAAVEAQKSLP